MLSRKCVEWEARLAASVSQARGRHKEEEEEEDGGQ